MILISYSKASFIPCSYQSLKIKTEKSQCPSVVLAVQVDEVASQAQRCAQAFAGLVELTRKHKTRNQLLGTALKSGGGFIEGLVKSSRFWSAYYIAYGRPFQQLVKTIQKGTKIMQARRLQGGGAAAADCGDPCLVKFRVLCQCSRARVAVR